jgi:hypothetical protein
MTRIEIQEMQKRIGATPDGFWGPQSIAACQKHLRKLMPKPHPWPKSDQASLSAFYGAAGDPMQLTVIPVLTLGVHYDGKPVKSIMCHHKVAQSLKRILEEIAAGPHAAILRQYAGVYNNRTMRNGTSPSLHARGAAIDLAPDANANSTHWPIRATMPLGVMESFAREGWLPAGAFWGRDAMHFQATR